MPVQVRTDVPTEDLAGVCELPDSWAIDRNIICNVLVAIVAGGTAETGFAGWEWPLNPDRVPVGSRGDASKCAWLAEKLDFEEPDWLHVLFLARDLGRSREFRHLVVALADELERVEVLDHHDLVRIRDATQTGAAPCDT
jgi:hypothetical protein